MRFTEKYWNGRWWPRETWDAMVAEQRQRIAASRAAGPASPMVIRDSMDDVLNPVNGQLYDSKRAYERDVRAAGCTIVGNESFNTPHAPPEVPGLERDIADAIQQLSAS